MKSLIILFFLPLIAIGQIELCDSPIEIRLSTDAFGNISWFSSTGDASTSQEFVFYVSDTGPINITLQYGDACISKTSKVIFIDSCTDYQIWMPSAVTIGSYNDSWFPSTFNCSVDSIFIFNRWGQMIYQSNTPWIPGNEKSKYPIDVYAVKVYFTVPHKRTIIKHGRITIIE